MHRRAFLIGLPLVAAGCGPGEPVWAPEEFVRRVAYRDPGPAQLTLFTVRASSDDSGAHTGLMINASQRVIFDPAGTFQHETIPERNDVFFGITPAIEQLYLSFHARVTYYVIRQDLVVSDAVAERALQLALAAGPVPKAACARATAGILQELPGMEFIRKTLSPERLQEQFAKVPGVVTTEYREEDDNDRFRELEEYVPEAGFDASDEIEAAAAAQ
ncbi:hypothetical protein [Pseudoroseicyclus tamaricis]|uniref:hypothetical protein n=1 Tax=Pseudoroseicyclus tamaricis TaxID=2705421 RepID=UPI001F28570E|nr:hypothetical protein [Pseudoroseicyclus tamaricis]